MVPLFLALTVKIGVGIMKDSYLNFSHSSFGKKLFPILGLTIPPELTRYRQYDPLVKDSIILSSPNNRMLFDECFPESKLTINEESSDLAGGLIFDATDIKTPSQLNDCYEFFTQQLKQLSNNGKILIVGLTITPKMSTLQACAQRALMGLVKSLAKWDAIAALAPLPKKRNFALEFSRISFEKSLTKHSVCGLLMKLT